MPALAETDLSATDADTLEGPAGAGSHATLLRRGRTARIAWLVLGLLLVGLAFAGAFLPLLPTTDFLILALPCFARSSPRLEAWLLSHPRFGPPLRAWREEKAIPRHARYAAWGGMMLGYGLFVLAVRPGPFLALIVGAAMLASALWIAGRPLPRYEGSRQNRDQDTQ